MNCQNESYKNLSQIDGCCGVQELVRKVWSKEITAKTNQQKSYFKSKYFKDDKAA
jgi:hypothetical protein